MFYTGGPNILKVTYGRPKFDNHRTIAKHAKVRGAGGILPGEF